MQMKTTLLQACLYRFFVLNKENRSYIYGILENLLLLNITAVLKLMTVWVHTTLRMRIDFTGWLFSAL